MHFLKTWREKAGLLKREIVSIYLACSNKRVPWHVRFFAWCIVGYALSPIDLIPDFIPILGYVDDLIILPLGIAIVIRMIPREILEESRRKAEAIEGEKIPGCTLAAAFIILFWVIVAGLIIIHFLNR